MRMNLEVVTMKSFLHNSFLNRISDRMAKRCRAAWLTSGWALPVGIVLAADPTSFAQDAIGPFISTVGTTVQEPGNGRNWAYLLWTANAPTLLNGRAHAIYSKAGDANAANPFTRVAIVSLQSEAITLAPLLGRAALLGEDTNTLHSDIDALFGRFVPQNLTLPEKLSAVVRGALVEEKHYGRLILLSRAHPSVAMALGFGHAEQIAPGQTTFEIREFERSAQTDGAVIGRVTVTAGAPALLPAPGIPVELKPDNARGHLNAQLRWSTPDALRRLSLMQHGYNVWRVRKDYADARNWGVTPPSPATLVSDNALTTAVRRVNRLPLLISKTFTAAEAANVTPPAGDPNTFFIVDDNDRGRSNIVTTLDFTNGARFYYFVTARDILGRDGAVSAGKEVQICNKLPPDAISDVEVANDSTWIGNNNRQRLRVLWPQATNTPFAEQQIKAYWVYRWTNIAQLRRLQDNRTNNLIGIVNHVAGQFTNTYLDNGAGAPTPANAEGKTFWYTVRAEDDGACSGNLSPHSAPVFGVLRDRKGPAGPVGAIEPVCYDPRVDYLGRTTNGTPGTGTFNDSLQFTVAGVRGDRLIAWMDFQAEVRAVGSTNVVARFTSNRQFFGPGTQGSFVGFHFAVPGQYAGFDLRVRATAGFANGEAADASNSLRIDGNLLAGDWRITLVFGADLQPQDKAVPCNRHFTVGPAEELQPLELIVQPKAGSKEVRVYRRVDDGPLDLIYQQPLTNLADLTIPDDGLPHGGGRVCYFACTLDEHGNASPLTRLGCTVVTESSAPPRPQLSPITSLGAEDAAQMVLSWFCPGVNLDRFEVGIASLGEPISSNCAPGFLHFIPSPNVPHVEPVPQLIATAAGFPFANAAFEFRRFRTPRPGAGFGDGDRYSISVDVQAGQRYLVYVKAIGLSGARSDRSNLEGFFWQVTVEPQPNVPWPARPLPAVGNSFGLAFDASFRPSCGSTNLPGVPVVRISFDGLASDASQCPIEFTPRLGISDPNALIPTNSVGDSLFPLVLFRQQVANNDFPAVSGDMVQVSPMMESIAWGLNGIKTVIYDPYVLIETGVFTQDSGIRGLYLRDTQPVISGSRYRYLLARFNKLGEIVEVIPAANELEVP